MMNHLTSMKTAWNILLSVQISMLCAQGLLDGALNHIAERRWRTKLFHVQDGIMFYVLFYPTCTPHGSVHTFDKVPINRCRSLIYIIFHAMVYKIAARQIEVVQGMMLKIRFRPKNFCQYHYCRTSIKRNTIRNNVTVFCREGHLSSYCILGEKYLSVVRKCPLYTGVLRIEVPL